MHATARAGRHGRLHLRAVHVHQAELERAADKLLLRRAQRQADMRRAQQRVVQPVVALVPARAAFLQYFSQLRTRQRGGQIAHAQAEIGRVVFPALKHLGAGPRDVRGVQHIAARQQHRLRGQIGVMRDQEPAFAAIGVFVALQAEAARDAPGAGGLAVPARAHGVGAVFDQPDAELGAHGRERIHIADVSAHMR